jgi:ketosteroid isomerase-like protein
MMNDVLVANQAFYEAHEARGFEAMSAIWEHSHRVVCIHPGWPILRGWTEVSGSWHRILGGPGRNQFIITNEAVAVEGDVAWVTCDENLVAGGAAGTVAATNIFSRNSGIWKLIAHHGSPVMGH